MKTMPELRDAPPTSRRTGWKPGSSSIATPRRASGLTMQAIDNVLYDAFGQRQVSTMYTGLNQYYVVMEVDPNTSAIRTR